MGTGGVYRLISALFRGDDGFEIPNAGLHLTGKDPLWSIFHHLTSLVLGRGGQENWKKIQSQVNIILRPEWIKTNLPFLEPDEIKDVLLRLGLCMKNGKGLFEAEWFSKGHPLAPYLNAKPSQFVKAMEEARHKERGPNNG
jgi:hypothetical protein